jgi:hypothetical protein
VQPETVIRWHRRGWSLFWWWRSRCPLGRPRLSPEVRELIATLSRDNPLWGAERVRGELLKLGIVVSKRSIRRYRWRHGPPALADVPRQPPSAHLGGGSVHGPNADLPDPLRAPLRRARPARSGPRERDGEPDGGVGVAPAGAGHAVGVHALVPHRDRDRVYGPDFPARAAALGIRTILTPVRAPRANAVAERLVGTLRRECLDHLIVVNERHLRALLAELADFYNAARPHRTLELQTPQPASRPTHGPIRTSPVLGGLHHSYERAA